MKMINSYIKSLQLAKDLILRSHQIPHSPLPCSRQRNHSTKLALQINCQVSTTVATSQKAQKKNKARKKWIKVNTSCKNNQKPPEGWTVSKNHKKTFT